MEKTQLQRTYDKLQDMIACRMATIELHLQMHASQHEADPKNWGLVGDLKRIDNLLKDILGEE